MSNTFIYEQGWLVEKPEMQIPIPPRWEDVQNKYREFNDSMSEYDKYIATLRRFKYDYPDPKKEMELGKDFEMAYVLQKNKDLVLEAIPITQRTYSEQEVDLKRLYDWIMDENRPKAQTFFTASELRNVAKEIEFRLSQLKQK